MTAPHDWDLVATADALAAGEISARELAQAYLERIERYDSHLNAYITVMADTALAEADASDERRAQNAARGPLDGVPLGLKDNIDVAGVPATGGMETRRDRVPETDAACVAALRCAGAVILGKHNLQEAAFGVSPVNPHYGSTHNAHRRGLTTGGSSTGAGAALAAALCAGALGTDTLGSVRLPAAYSGICALKPTHGLVSIRGVLPLSWGLDSVGPMARSARDLSPLAAAIAVYDAGDAVSVAADQPLDWGLAFAPTLAGLNIEAISMQLK